MSKHKELLIRVYVTMFAFALCAMVLSFKAVKISVIEGERWRAKGDSLWLSHFPVEAERGDILSADGRLLATSVPSFEIRMDTRADGITDKDFQEGVDSLALMLSKYANTSWSQKQYKDYLIKARAKGNRYLLIYKNATYNELNRFRKFPIFRRGRYKGGMIVEYASSRTRPYGILAARTIGYVRKEVQPVGLEGQYDHELKGEEGRRLMRRLVGGTWVPVEDLGQLEARRGRDVRTTIDIDMQDIVQSSLINAVTKHQAQYGTAVLMEVQTGKIVAIANIGHVNGVLQDDYNYAVGYATEPGSTMKLASVMAMFEDGFADPDTRVNLNKGYKRFHNRELKDSENHNYEEVDLRKAFEISSNVGIAALTHTLYGSERKADKFIARLKQFGMQKPTGIDLPGEASPYLKEAFSTAERWSGTSLPWISIGYECQFTALQVLNLYNAVANNGRLMKPYLVDAILEDGRVVKRLKPEALSERIASPTTISFARELLEGVATRGTASKIPSPHVTFAGKTGTAVTNYFLNDGGKKNYQSSFVGYFPAQQPRYSCIIVVNNPQAGKYYGSSVALPVFLEIAEQCMALDPVPVAEKLRVFDTTGVRPIPEGIVLHRSDAVLLARDFRWDHREIPAADWIYIMPGETGKFHEVAIHEQVLPDVRGMGLRDALYLLENAGFTVRVSGVGLVHSQSPAPGTTVSRGMQVELKLHT